MRMAGKVGAKRETSKEKKGGSGVCVGGGGSSMAKEVYKGDWVRHWCTISHCTHTLV
jgi:hypothetical protein